MIYNIFNGNDIYTHDPDIALNGEYYLRKHNDSEMMK